MVKTYGIQVLYDNDELAILNKPSGMKLFECANPTRRVTKAAAPSLEALLLKQGMELSSLNPDRSRGFVHRLDVGTSGCLVLAKTNSMHAQLISKFFLRQVQKSYIALVSTTTPCTGGYRRVPDAGTVNLAIDRRPAQSSFQTLERYGSLAAKLREITRQGRKHQVRLHCSKGLQTPILLDPLYGGERIMYKLDSVLLKDCRARQQFCLHADTLSIPDLNITAEAPTPEWWDAIIQEIGCVND